MPETARGVMFALLAYGAWGVLPVYWKLLGGVPSVQVLAHRMLWSLPFVVALGLVRRRRQGPGVPLHPRVALVLAVSAALLACNWGMYIHGVNTDRVVETSLGYFINPLVNVALGFVFLRERFSRLQAVSVALAATGVAVFIWDGDQWPWIALGLAFSFGFYGLLRKLAPVDPLRGLAVETLWLAPLALGALAYWHAQGRGVFATGDLGLSALLVGTGVVTSLPLLWFAAGARRLRLSTIGLFQYLAPSLQLVIGVWLYGEPFTRTHAVAFGFIWTALALYSLGSRGGQVRAQPVPAKK